MQEEKYKISFTAGTLMVEETCAVAEVFLETGCNWNRTREYALRENLMQKEKVSTNKRLFSLVKQRIEVLNEEELNLLVAGTNSVRRLLLLLAVCKAHSFIFDFIFINVRDCLLRMNEKITHAYF